MSDTPVLFVIFNRPETTFRVFEKIKKNRPKRLYIASDGPRTEEDVIKVKKARSIIERIDWDCEVSTFFRSQNVGMALGYFSAVQFLFDNEEKGIILEDDTLPSQSFFRYCSELLDKYQDDTRVMNICGFNACEDMKSGNDSYFFSYLGHAWGWATWRRAWNLCSFSLQNWDRVQQYSTSPYHSLAYFRKGFESLAAGSSKSCVLRWYYAIAVQNGLNIIPRQSLIQNIGIGEDSTTTLSSPPEYANMTAHELEFPLTHPVAMFSNFQFDSFRMPKNNAPKSRVRKLLSKCKHVTKNVFGGE